MATVIFPDPQNPNSLNLGSIDSAGTLTPTRVVTVSTTTTAVRVRVAASSTFVAATLADGTLNATRLGPSVTTIVVAANVNSMDLDCTLSTCGYEWSTVNGQFGLSVWDSMSPGLTPAPLNPIGFARDVSLSHLPNGWISAFASTALGSSNVFLTSTGGSASLLSVGANAQRLPTASWDGQEFLVDLLDHSLGGVGSNVFTARFTADAGTAGSSVILTNGFESVALTPWSTSRIGAITVASFENQMMNLWANPSTPQPNLDAGFVIFSGAVGARPRLAMQPSGSIGALCWNAGGVNVALMTIAGISTMPLKLSSTTLSGQCEVAVTSTGYLVAWREFGGGATLRAMRLTTSLVPVDVDGGLLLPAGTVPSMPTIASVASTAVIAWSQSPGASTLAAAKLDLLTGSISTIPLPTKDDAPALTWTGNEMILAYQSLDDAGVSNVVGVSIDPFAPLASSSSAVFSLATSADPEFTPALASDRNGTVLLAYGRYDSSAGVHDQMVKLRVLKLPTVTTCNTAADCPAGKFCADGVCCDTACGNSNPSDCQACTVAAGGLLDGTCTLSAPNWMCAPASMCSPASFCSGMLSTCPAPVSGCDAGVDAGPPDSGVDAGPPDAAVDAGPRDAGIDGGTADAAVDAGLADAAVDAGGVDAGTDDAGTDAGTGDAGTVTSDAGGTADAGTLDAGASDAGQDPTPILRQLTLGCGCATSDSSTVFFALLALLTVQVGRRRNSHN